jgi:hypothetical protein
LFAYGGYFRGIASHTRTAGQHGIVQSLLAHWRPILSTWFYSHSKPPSV